MTKANTLTQIPPSLRHWDTEPPGNLFSSLKYSEAVCRRWNWKLENCFKHFLVFKELLFSVEKKMGLRWLYMQAWLVFIYSATFTYRGTTASWIHPTPRPLWCVVVIFQHTPKHLIWCLLYDLAALMTLGSSSIPACIGLFKSLF